MNEKNKYWRAYFESKHGHRYRFSCRADNRRDARDHAEFCATDAFGRGTAKVKRVDYLGPDQSNADDCGRFMAMRPGEPS